MNVGAEYFQPDDDELLGENDDEKMPLWRGDPEDTHSDWTIVVNEEKAYHIHKFVLVAGPRSCKLYFPSLFRPAVRTSEQEDSTSRITLPKDQADAFPIMLDFMYSSDEELAVHTDNAVTLRSLANYFGCTALTKTVNKFIQKDLTTNTAAAYLHNAFLCNDEKLEASARNLILKNYSEIETESLSALPYELFRSIICSPDLNKDEHCNASYDVHQYFTANPNALNARSLNELTNHLSMVVDGEEAEGLMAMVEKLSPNEEDEISLMGLDKFYKLCAERIACKWKDVDTQELMDSFYNPRVKGDYRGSGRSAILCLAVSLEQAKSDYIYKCEEVERLQTEKMNWNRDIHSQQRRIDELAARVAELGRLVSSPRPSSNPPKRKRARFN
jgi:hypothetical protein